MPEPGAHDWSTSATIRSRVLREWERGNLLAARLIGESIFPWCIALKGPSSATLADRFDEVRQWIRALAEAEKLHNGTGYRLEFQDINHRQLGRKRSQPLRRPA
jgi:hypothetical protein